MAHHPPSSILHPRRIVVRGTNWLGDAVMTTPALHRLRECFPDADIALLTPEKLSDLYRGHPAIDEILPILPDDGLPAVARKLREKHFDTALILPNSPRSALEAWLAGIPHRVGYDRPWRNFFLTRAIGSRPEAVKMRKLSVAEIKRRTGFQPVSNVNHEKTETGRMPVQHQIHDYLHLVAALGASPEPLPPQLAVAPAEIEAVKLKFGLPEIVQPLFGLAPGAEYGPAKRWPVEKFIAAAQEIRKRTSCAWLLLGTIGDAALTGRIAAALAEPPNAVQNLAGKTSLRELMALLKSCRALLTNDTGPMHVAAALGVPVVVPFGSTSPELTGPGLPGDARHRLLKSDAPCSPCFRRECPIDFRCMNRISVAQVVQAVVEAFER